jgi:hypothetical protein
MTAAGRNEREPQVLHGADLTSRPPAVPPLGLVSQSRAIVVLGMHRSGTSCLAAMLAPIAWAGEAVRNWDNARGHHEMLDLVRLDEAVLAHSGGHWLAPPAQVRWTDDHAAARDRLLQLRTDGRPALLKDPRMLLVLPFWRASQVPFDAIGIVRHPLAVARSLEAWREMPLADGIALWTTHNRVLAADREQHGTPVIDFERAKPEVVAAVTALYAGADAAAYEGQLVHHDDADPPALPGLADAVALYRRLGGASGTHRGFPRAELAAFHDRLRAGAMVEAFGAARHALANVGDAAAVLVPVVTALVRHRAFAEAHRLIDLARVDASLADLLRGKVALAQDDALAAVRHLEAACAAPQPFFQARHLLPQALRRAGRAAEARAALLAVAADALYPHGPLATLAEWSSQDGNAAQAIAEIADAIAAAPPHRRGRLRTRRAEWLLAAGDAAGARAELQLAIAEDPQYARSRHVLAAIPTLTPV